MNRTRGRRAPFGPSSFTPDGKLLFTEFWMIAFSRLAIGVQPGVVPDEENFGVGIMVNFGHYNRAIKL